MSQSIVIPIIVLSLWLLYWEKWLINEKIDPGGVTVPGGFFSVGPFPFPWVCFGCFPTPQVIFPAFLYVFTHKNSKNFGIIFPQGCDFPPATAKPLALFCKEKCQRALGPRSGWVLEAARTSRASHPLSCAVKGGYKKII